MMSIEDFPVWVTPPDWAQPVREGLGWLTAVMTSQPGVEQRQSVRRSPRRYLEFSVTAIGVWRSYVDAILSSQNLNHIYLPAWHEIGRLRVAAVGTVDTSLRLMGIQQELAASRTLFIQGDKPWKYELVEVTGTSVVNGDTVFDLTAPVSGSWPAKTSVFPCNPVKIFEQPNYNRLSDDAIQAIIRFDFDGPNDWAGTNSYTTYRSFPVIEVRPNEGDTQSGSYFRYTAQVDNQVGVTYLEDLGGISFSTTSIGHMAVGRMRTDELRSLLYRLRGRAAQAWIVQPTADFVLTQIAPAHATALTVRRCGFYDLGGASEGRQDIRILRKDGTSLYRRIVSGGISPENEEWEIINLDSEVTSGLTLRDVDRISFLSPGRLDQDEIEIEHETDTEGVATATIVFKTVPDQRIATDWSPPALIDDTAGDCAPQIAGFWARVNDGDWNGNPAANPSFRYGAVPINSIAGNLYPVIGFNTGLFGSKHVTANFGGNLFQEGIPEKAAAWGPTTILDPDHKAAPVVLLEDDLGRNLTASVGGEVSGAYVRATSHTGTQFGLRYYEVTITEASQNNYIGFATSGASMGPRGLSNLLINDHGVLYSNSGAIYVDGSDTGVNAGSFTTGDVVSICVYTVNPT